MNWKDSDTLSATQSAQPIRILDHFVLDLPTFTDDVLTRIFNDGKSRSKRLRTWGHTNPYDPHFLATRSGTTLHTDPKYPRFTLHLLLHNGGFRIEGLGRKLITPLTEGIVYMLDTHSPHQVVRDDRLQRKSDYKIQAAIDSDSPFSAEAAVRLRNFVLQGNLIERMFPHEATA